MGGATSRSANVAAQVQHPAFEAVLARLVADDNGRVRQAAENAALRRRDSRHQSTLGKQHVERLNTTLDDIEARFGPRGRDAVRRAADQVANTFARELYHEGDPSGISTCRFGRSAPGAAVGGDRVVEWSARRG